MSKNNVTNSRFLLNIATKRGTAYRNLRDMCWDNDTQSDASAGKLSAELESELTNLMRGDFETINRKLAEYSRHPPVIAIRPPGTFKKASGEDFYTTTRLIRIGHSDVQLGTTRSNAATPEELIYGVLRRALESGDIKHLALCQQCDTLYYRKSTKGKFCSDDCHDAHFNHLEGRAEQAHNRYVKKMKDLKGPGTKVARRPREKG